MEKQNEPHKKKEANSRHDGLDHQDNEGQIPHEQVCAREPVVRVSAFSAFLNALCLPPALQVDQFTGSRVQQGGVCRRRAQRKKTERRKAAVEQEREAAAAAETAAEEAMEQERETVAAAKAAAEAAVDQERAAAADEVRVVRNRAKKHAKMARRKVSKATKANSSGALALGCGVAWCGAHAPQLPKVGKAKARRAVAVVQVRWFVRACVSVRCSAGWRTVPCC
jgi:hypothetical protein